MGTAHVRDISIVCALCYNTVLQQSEANLIIDIIYSDAGDLQLRLE